LPLNGHIGKLFFVKTFLKDHNIAALTPTSEYAVKKILGRFDWSRDRVVMEYGPGTGVFTKGLLERMTPGSKLILIDTNPEFVSLLRRVQDPRMRVFQDSAENIRRILSDCGEAHADYILSGIPFSFFQEDQKMGIVRDTRRALAPGGRFVVYQYSPHIRKYLRRCFPSVSTELELFHVPPLFVFEASS
jgi:phospholipid N-methyltransferase